MAINALISVLCPDRVGLVAAITGYLFDRGADLGDTSFAVLGAGAEFNTVCELPDDVDLLELEAGLKALPELAGAESVTVSRFEMDAISGPSGRVTHQVTVDGADRPGLMARLCEVLVDFGANIVRLNAQRLPTRDGGRYVLQIAVSLPEERATTCMAAVANTAGSLRLSCEWTRAWT